MPSKYGSSERAETVGGVVPREGVKPSRVAPLFRRGRFPLPDRV